MALSHMREVSMQTDAQKRAKAKWDAKTMAFMFRLRLKEDRDVIARIKSMPNKTDYLRVLVRRDINGK